jgi:hypothetical protein
MTRAGPAIALAALASGCVIVVDDSTQLGTVPELPDAGDAGIGVGGGGGGGGGGFGGGGGGGAAPHPIPGSGDDGDNGTALVVLLRVDQGIANTADGVARLVVALANSLSRAHLTVTSIAVGDLYAPHSFYWTMRAGRQQPPDLAATLRALAVAAPATPSRCAAATVIELENMLPNWFAGTPGAVLVAAIDSGSRPVALPDCPQVADLYGSDPIYRISPTFRRAQSRFLFIATPENGDLDAMRTHCLSVAGYPPAAVDVIAPSTLSFYDPLAAQMDHVLDRFATRVDFCDALGSGVGTIWDDLSSRWYDTLKALP